MTRQRTCSHDKTRPSSRRLGIIPGRRFALVLALTGAVVAGSGAVAVADDSTVVTATVYDGSSGGPTSLSATVNELDNCPQYSGSNPVYLYSGGSASSSPVTVPRASWALETVLTCALNIPLSSVTSVAVINGTSGVENPLTSAQLSDPSQWSDPSAPDALPLIFPDGGDNQNTYVRPWAGGSDDNAADHIVEAEPIAIVVQENAAPLTVKASSQQQSPTTFSFSATVTGSGGTPVPASNLTYSWSFDDGGTSSTPTPTHTFAPGSYAVTVEVTDAADGLEGTANIEVQVASVPGKAGTTPQSGGTPTSPSKTPTGPSHSGGTKPGTKPGKSSSSSGTGHSGQAATKGSKATSATGTGSSSGTSAATAGAGASASSSASGKSSTPAGHHTTPVKRHQAAATGRASLVSGRLVSDVIPLSVAVSPLVHVVPGSAATAPAVRRAVTGSSSPWSAIGAGLAVLVLFGLGAGREVRWRRPLPS